ncbi:MAG: hypothetical protein E7255_10860 [Lachnospiraceae bacterium]|jgi:hypothetical protein|nr:hypothetical protein [Lachnospiraceae bacterium]
MSSNVKRQAGSSKSKAKLLKTKGSEAEGYFTISDKVSKVDWYKFSVPAPGQHVGLTLYYMLDGDISYQILDSKGKIVYDSDEEGELPEGFYRFWMNGEYSKGTYYVKVFKGSKKSSFNYTIVLAMSE